jgi:hypothetical protein
LSVWFLQIPTSSIFSEIKQEKIMPTFTDTSYVSPLRPNAYYLYSVWKNFAALRAESTDSTRRTPFRAYSAPKKSLVASLLEDKTPRPTDTLYFCTLDTVERADKFVAEMDRLGIEVHVLNEFDCHKTPYCDAIRLAVQREGGSGPSKPHQCGVVQRLRYLLFKFHLDARKIFLS